jgi:DNA-binding HxlR family transcriptional regulator
MSSEAAVHEHRAHETCPVINSLERIGSKWRLIVIHVLQDGEKRFNDLKRASGASSQTLSRVLDDLEELGFVDRRVDAEGAVAVYYSLTAKGEELAPLFVEVELWAEEWLEID